MRSPRSSRGFVLGVLVGLVFGSATAALATFSYKGWQRFSNDFKVGYVTGFLDMANLTRNLDPGGWVDQKYPIVPGVKPMQWTAYLGELYEKPDNQKYTIASLLQLAAHDLQKKHGSPSVEEKRIQQTIEQIRKIQEKAKEAAAKAAQNADAAAKSPAPAVEEEDEEAKEPKGPKFCRCDDCVPRRPKFREAAAHKAAAEAAADAEVEKVSGDDGEAGKPSPDAAPKAAAPEGGAAKDGAAGQPAAK